MKYSSNAGQPVKEVKVVTLSQGMAILRKVQNNGKVFRVDFTKKNGKLRTMVCRCGVRSKLSGGKAGYSFVDKGLLSVYEFGTGYRTVSVDEITLIKFAGVAYLFDAVVPKGTYSPSYIARSMNGGRTVEAKTSPMYNLKKELV